MIIDNGWSGVTFWNGNAYFKKVDYDLKKEHLKQCGGCITWIYDATKNKNTEEEEAEEETEEEEAEEETEEEEVEEDTGSPWTEFKGYDLKNQGNVHSINSWKSKHSWSEL